MTHSVRWLRTGAHLIFALGSLAVVLAITSGFLGRFAPAFDSFSHFRLHLGTVAVLAALAAVALRHWWVALATAVAGIAALATALPFVLSGPTGTGPGSPAGYSLLQMNVLYDAPEPAEALRRIAELQPDIVTLQEMTADWQAVLSPLAFVYPHQLHCNGADGRWGDSAILSRRPFAADAPTVCDGRNSLAAAVIDLNGAPVTIVSHHQLWPWPYGQWERLARLRPRFAKLPQPLILAGDFNAVPWSAVIEGYERALGATAVRGIGGSWLTSRLPIRWAPAIGLPIDNVLASPGIAVIDAATVAATSSDHLPVLVRFSLAPPAASEPPVAVVQVVR